MISEELTRSGSTQFALNSNLASRASRIDVLGITDREVRPEVEISRQTLINQQTKIPGLQDQAAALDVLS
jgi:hypothetical protein